VQAIGLGGITLKKGHRKSQVEFYLRLHAQLIRSDPLETVMSEQLSLVRDLEYLHTRVSNEGLAFLTKTLPLLGKAFDRALVSGIFNAPLGFKRSHWSASIPAFLQAYFKMCFDTHGFLLDVAPIGAVRHIRQVLYFAYKLETPYSEDDNSRVIDEFVATDAGLAVSDDPLALDILSLAKIITRKVFDGFDHKEIQPRHGPGAVATGEQLEEKWIFSRLYNAIHQVYPYYNYYIVGGVRELTDRLDWYRSLRRLESGCAKVVLVPKDSRGPRLISCEPLEYQWIQQGLGRKLAEYLEFVSTYTRHHINFTRQEINRGLAQTSSASQRFATLDLKDASDRVSLELVRRVFERTPELLRALEACRTTETKLPDGRVITLNKYAPMGSALCFPVEAYIFWVVVVSAVINGKNMPLENVGRRIFVYGDDIIVPVEWAALSIQGLEAVGLKVNIDKSCITGFFRESCGMDAYKGHPVTPLRLRTPWSNQIYDGSALLSYTALANEMASSGYTKVSDAIFEALENLYGKLPYGTSRASFPCRVVDSPLRAEALNMHRHRRRFNRNYQRVEYFLPSLSSRRKKSVLDGWPRALRDILMPPYGDPSFVVVPLSTKIKRGWMGVA